jgi:hypothetical protein
VFFWVECVRGSKWCPGMGHWAIRVVTKWVGKNEGGETVLVQTVLVFARPSIVKCQVLSLPHSFRYCLHTLLTFS